MFTPTSNIEEFSVDKKFGDIRVVISPDRESRDRYEMTVVIVFDSSDEISRTPLALSVVIIITDQNDNSPQFPRKIIPMTITESQPVGFKIPLDPAEDPDLGTNSTQTYQIINEGSPFRLEQQKLGFDDQYSCNLELERSLDREYKDYYVIEIVASDGGNPRRSDKMTLQIKVADVNDNTPQFNQSIYRPSILENAPVGSVVCTVLATDNDKGDNAKITYLIEPRFNKDGLFSIDPDTGIISLSGSLDRETSSSHELVVRATDNGEFPERTTVRVSVTVQDVNDNTPQINPTFLSQEDEVGMVSEASKVGDYVAHVNVDDLDTGDNGKVELTLHGEGAPFEIVKVGAGYAIQVSGPLDRESRDTWHVWLEARDGGVPSRVAHKNITIKVVDVNDCEPVFQEAMYRCNVSEIAEKGTDIVQVTATDDDLGVNAEISYKIVTITTIGQNNGDLNTPISFSINSKTGVISTGSQIDREARESVKLTVEAQDGGNPTLRSRCTVIVDIIDYNDNDPRFAQRHYTTLVREDAMIGSEVLTVHATDADAGGLAPLTYSIKDYYSAARSVFAIDPSTGVITTSADLDYEQQKSFNLVVEAHDHGGRRGVTSVEVLIRDLNDNSPQFSQATYRASLLHTVLPGTLVTRVSAFDVDAGLNGVVSYSILQGAEMFAIEPKTGFIRTAVSLRGLTNVTERLIVQAVDGGSPQQSSVCNILVLIGSLNTIDLKPIFTSQEYSIDVAESLEVGHVITTVFARSPDPDYSGSIKYTISKLTQQVHDSFTIGEDSGRITSKSTLDRETEDFYNFVVEATDELGRQGMAAIQVTVTDVNDNKAQFSATSYHFSVNENLDEGVVVAQITASDLDYGINGLVQYLIVHGESDLPFNLDSYTGTIYLTEELDFETRTSYQFTVRAFNKVTPNFYQETPVRISVLDVNDNSPLFVQSHFHFNLLDSSLDNAAVGVAMATDADSGRNGDVYYTLQPTVNSHLFEVDLKTGEIRTAVVFANRADLQEQYNLKVLCRDRGVPSLNSSALVTVEVLSTGQVVDILQQVLSNDAISRKAKYLIVFFAAAFLFSTVVLVCFIKYHRDRKSKYRNLTQIDRKYDPPPAPGPAPMKSSENLMSLGGGEMMGLSSDTLLSRPPKSTCSNNYKYVECGSYCPSIPEREYSQEIISTSFFADNNHKTKLSRESLPPPPPPNIPTFSSKECLNFNPSISSRIPETLLPDSQQVTSRSDLGSSYDLSPACSNKQCHDNRCHSNESGVASGLGSTPPTSEINFLKKELELRKDSWMSSDDSLFKVKNPASSLQSLPGQKVNLNDKRQVRFQKLNDSYV